MKMQSIGRKQTGDMPISQILMLALIGIPLVLGGIYFLQSSFAKASKEAGVAKSQSEAAQKAGEQLKSVLN